MLSATQKAQPKRPHWYHPDAPLGSAARYVASLSGRFHWVGIYILKKDVLELGPYMGECTDSSRFSQTKLSIKNGICGRAVVENRDLNIPNLAGMDERDDSIRDKAFQSEMVTLVRNKKFKILGLIDIQSHISAAFGDPEEKAVKQVAEELGILCTRMDFNHWRGIA